MIKKTPYLSYCSKDICEGCKMCVQGKKLVLFVNGLCSRNCFYCPLSEKRKNKNVSWANERKLSNDTNIAIKEAIEEAKITNAWGMGITGGDPLFDENKTIKFIQAFKKEFGKSFHIHVYLIPETANEKNLAKLFKAGLDEVRFHPNILKDVRGLDDEIKKIKLANKFRWDVGIEIPSLPDSEKNIFKLIDKTYRGVSFINLNELEVSDANLDLFSKMNYKIDENDVSGYVIKGSKETALKILKYCSKKYPNLLVHFCSARTKNLFQYKRRLMIRAKNIKTTFDKLNKYGDLERNIIYLKEFYPGFGYENKIENLSSKEKARLSKLLEQNKKSLLKIGIKDKELILDKINFRFITSKKILSNFSEEIKNLKLKPAFVAELPTYYSLPLDIEFL